MENKIIENREGYCKCGCGEKTKIITHTCKKKGLVVGEFFRYCPGHHMRGIPKLIVQRNKMAKARREWYHNNPEKAIAKGLKESKTKIEEGTHRLSNNVNWKGGISYEGYDFAFSERFKEAIKLRDNRCLLCNLSIINANLLNKLMHVHHIDYNQQNTTKENCCTLCHNCHSSVQIHKKQWTLFFRSLLEELYSYKYSKEVKKWEKLL
jgi:hypothetical protein